MDTERIYVGRDEDPAPVLRTLLGMVEDTRTVVWVPEERAVDAPTEVVAAYVAMEEQERAALADGDPAFTVPSESTVGTPALSTSVPGSPEPLNPVVQEEAQGSWVDDPQVGVLRARLEELGVKVDGRWRVPRLQQEVATAEAAAAGGPEAPAEAAPEGSTEADGTPPAAEGQE